MANPRNTMEADATAASLQAVVIDSWWNLKDILFGIFSNPECLEMMISNLTDFLSKGLKPPSTKIMSGQEPMIFRWTGLKRVNFIAWYCPLRSREILGTPNNGTQQIPETVSSPQDEALWRIFLSSQRLTFLDEHSNIATQNCLEKATQNPMCLFIFFGCHMIFLKYYPVIYVIRHYILL